MLSNHLEAKFLLFENYSHSSSTLPSKIIRHILKYKQKNKCVRVYKIMRLIIMKMKMKMKNRSLRCDINRPRSRHWHKYSKYKKRVSVMMLICIKHHLSKTEAEMKKIVAYKKSVQLKRLL